MRLLALLVALAGAPDAPVVVPRLAPSTPSGHGGTGETRCAACHTTSTWSAVRFNHDKTGFKLEGRHARVDCRGCHVADFTTPLPRQCAACHRDAHNSELGAHCESCHDTSTWKSPFDADAHRKSNFPLVGAHAVIPCQECHAEVRDRNFTRPTVTCTDCHQRDLARTYGTGVDHRSLSFSQDCQACHGAFSFRPARFPAHDGCFLISYGSHAGFSCATCHLTLPAMVTPGACNTRTADCVGCHTHACTVGGGQTETDRQHQGVAGYQCQSRKCYDCHQAGERR